MKKLFLLKCTNHEIIEYPFYNEYACSLWRGSG